MYRLGRKQASGIRDQASGDGGRGTRTRAHDVRPYGGIMIDVKVAPEGQVQRFEALRAIIGADAALFVMCAYLDLPYDPSVSTRSWDGYVKIVRAKKVEARFQDGETNIRSALEDGMADVDRWKREWGVGDDESPYSPEDYRRLDEIFKTLAARLQGSGGYDAQQEFTLRNCSHMALLREKCIRKGDKESVSKAKDLDRMISDNLAAENLRKKDEKPVQTARLDGIVESIGKKYGVGLFSTYDQVMEAIVKWLNEKHRYANSQDAAEQALLAIINCTRVNSDMPILTEIPSDAYLDQYAGEFDNSKPQREREKQVYDYLQIKPRTGQTGRR